MSAGMPRSATPTAAIRDNMQRTMQKHAAVFRTGDSLREALTAGREDLARVALTRKSVLERQAASITEQRDVLRADQLLLLVPVLGRHRELTADVEQLVLHPAQGREQAGVRALPFDLVAELVREALGDHPEHGVELVDGPVGLDAGAGLRHLLPAGEVQTTAPSGSC